jgi:hypothetical protein
MDDCPYATFGADGWLRCDGLHHPGFPTLLWDVLHRSATRGLPCTVAARTMSSGMDAVRSTWMFWLTLPTRA